MQAAHSTFAAGMNHVFLLLGSNEGDRVRWLTFALTAIAQNIGQIQRQSGVYETAAWGNTHQPSFLNMAIEVSTILTPHDLLVETQAIEHNAGRNRSVKWGQRTLDIDLLFYDDLVMQTEVLTLPHPHLHERRFTLEPLVEIAPDFVHPVLKKTISELLEDCPDTLSVTKLQKAPLL